MAELFVRKLAVHLPSLGLIEANGTSVGLDYAKAKCGMPTTANLGFRAREQLCADAKFAAAPPNPQISDPFVVRQADTHDFAVGDGHPGGRPLRLSNGNVRSDKQTFE